MHIVIDIPEKLFNIAKDGMLNEIQSMFICGSVTQGIPLPKGHGRLIDENYLLCILQCEEYETCTWGNCEDCNREKCVKRHNLPEVPAIIEADKGGIEL